MIKTFLNSLVVENNLSHHTIESYSRDLIDFVEHYRHFPEISRKEMNEYIIFLTDKQYSARSIHRKISAIRHFFQFLRSEKICNYNPCLEIDLPKIKMNLPKALSRSEIELLGRTCMEWDNNGGVRLQAIFEILYATGMRISELLTLKMGQIQDIATDRPMIIVNGKGNKERIVFLNKTAILALKRYILIRLEFCKNIQNNWLFPSLTKNGKVAHLTRQRFGQLLKEVAIRAGLDHHTVSPHVIRHSFASHLLQNGAEICAVQSLLGHSDISSTQIYTKILNDQAKKFVLENHPMMEH